MRLLLGLISIACFASGAYAQNKSDGVQEQKPKPMADRHRSEQVLGEPDRTRAFQNQGKTFGGANAAYTKSAYVKPFHFLNVFRPKTYETQKFAGTRNDWQGDFKYETSEAETKGRYVVPNAATKVPTMRATVKKAPESGREKVVNTYAGGSRQFLNKGKSQKILDAQYGKDQGPMTIQQVRELLNKN